MRSEQEIQERITKIKTALEKTQNVASAHKWHYKEVMLYLRWTLGEDIDSIL